MNEDELRSQVERESELSDRLAAALEAVRDQLFGGLRIPLTVINANILAALAQHAASRSGKV